MVENLKTALVAIVVVALGLFAVAVVWFAVTHECAKSHPEQRMSCTTVSFGKDIAIGSADCRPYTADVCDEWVQR